MTESPDQLVARYRALTFPSDELGDCDDNWAKTEILRQLDPHANDPAVGQLLLEVLSSPAEFDLARIEAAKIVRLVVKEASPLERELKLAVWEIFADSSQDTMTRQHASQNLSAGFGGAAEQDIVERILFDEDDDLNVRYGALSYVEQMADQAFVRRLLPRLRVHEIWSQYFD